MKRDSVEVVQETLTQDELLLRLPCPIGGRLWRVIIQPTRTHYIGHIFVKPITLNRHNFWRIVVGGEFGNIVFLTEEEAQAAADAIREGVGG